MKIYVNWRSALRAIKKNKKRSILTMFGIVIGIASVIAILSLGKGYERQTIKSLTDDDSEKVKIEINFNPNDMNLYNTNMAFFQEPDLNLLRGIDGVESAELPKNETDSTSVDVMVKGKKKSKTLKLVNGKSKAVDVGRTLNVYDNQTANKVAVIDSILAKDLYGTSENAIGQGIEVKGQMFSIVGVFPGEEEVSMFSMGSDHIQVPKRSYERYFEPERLAYSVELTLADGVKPNAVTTKAVNALKDNGMMRSLGEYQVFDSAILTDGVSEVLNTITLFISAVAGISLFIAGVGVMNMMYISVSERTKEIGIRRALGATRNAIRLQFLLEGLTLTLIGGIIGYILGIILAYIIGSAANIEVVIDPFIIMLAIGVSSAIGLIFSVMPASEAAKKDLIDIMK